MTPTDRREIVENKILELFEIVEEPKLESDKENGLGKYDLKRILKMEKGFEISINTVKVVVDNLLKTKVIKCINPDDKTGFRFRLRREDET